MTEARRPGGLAVAIHSSDPRYGDPRDFVFYLEQPYTPETLTNKRRAMVKLFVETMKKKGYTLTSPIRFRGPYEFTDHDRITLDTKHMGEDEFQLNAWFKRDHPLIVPADVIDMWAERRRKFGYEVNAPQPIGEPLRPAAGMPLENDWLSDREKGLST